MFHGFRHAATNRALGQATLAEQITKSKCTEKWKQPRPTQLKKYQARVLALAIAPRSICQKFAH